LKTLPIQIEKYRLKNTNKDTIVRLCYDPTGKFLVSADRSGEIAVLSKDNPRNIRFVHSPDATVTGVWFSEDGKWLLVGHQAGLLRTYNLANAKFEAEIQLKTGRPKGYVLAGTSIPVLDYVVLTVCPRESENLYAILEFRDFFTIQREDFREVSNRHESGSLFECATASLNGRYIFLGDALGYIYRVTLPKMKLETYAEHHERVRAFDLAMRPTTMDTATGIAALCLSHDNKLVASTSRSGGVQIWRTETERPENVSTREFRPFAARGPVRGDWIRGVCFVPNSNVVVLGAEDGTVETWNFATSQVTDVAECPAGVRGIDISPDGAQFAIGCEDGSVFLVPWNQVSH